MRVREQTTLVIHGVAILLVTLLAVRDLAPSTQPSVAGDDAARDRRALLSRVKRLAAAPHALGTAGHDQARDYLLSSLRGMGLQPQLQQTEVSWDADQLVRVARVQNVLVRIEGKRAGQKALLLATHYDSFSHSPAAADAGASVAALLEIARVFTREPPEHPLVLLFSDGEEWGLLGARAFVEQHPWARTCAAVINLDARGSGGRPFVFELAGSTAELARLLAHSGAPANAVSYAELAYRSMGNDTDFSVFRRAGLSGYNLAFFEDSASYHTALDRPERLDPDSLLLQYQSALALARTLGSVDLGTLARGPEAIYVRLPFGLLHYPRTWSVPLCVVAALLGLVLAVTLARRRGGVRALLRASGATLASFAAATLAAWLFAQLGTFELAPTLVRWEQWDGFFVSAVLSAVLFAGLALAKLLPTTDRLLALLGGVVVTALLALSAGFAAPELAYVPLLFLIAGSALAFREARRTQDAGRSWTLLHAGLLAPGLFALVQAGCVVGAALGLRAAWPVIAAAAFAGLWLWLPLAGRLPTRLGPALALVALGFAPALWARTTATFDLRNPLPTSLLFALDLTTGEAAWASLGEPPDEWALRTLSPLGGGKGADSKAQPGSLGPFFGGGSVPATIRSVPPPPMAGPALRASKRVGEQLAFAFRAESGAFATRCDLYTESPIRSVRVNGRALPVRQRDVAAGQAAFTLVYLAPGPDEVNVEVTLARKGRLSASVVDVHDGFPASLPALPARPAHVVPDRNGASDITLVRRSLDVTSTTEPISAKEEQP